LDTSGLASGALGTGDLLNTTGGAIDVGSLALGGADSAALGTGGLTGGDLYTLGGTDQSYGLTGLQSSDTGAGILSSPATAGSAAAPGGLNWDSIAKIATKYGPLGLSVLNTIRGNNMYDKAAGQLGALGGTQRGAGNALVQGYESGTLNPAENAQIDTWANQQVAAIKQFYANAGTPNSTQEQAAIAQIQAQATQQKNTAMQSLLQTGLTALNGVDQNTAAAIETTLKGSQAALQAQNSFSEQFAKLIGATGSGGG
jgi:hypothetical protein